jgi:hypothetical protein
MSRVPGAREAVKRVAIVVAIQLAAAAVSILDLLHYELTNLLQPSREETDLAAGAALGARPHDRPLQLRGL